MRWLENILATITGVIVVMAITVPVMIFCLLGMSWIMGLFSAGSTDMGRFLAFVTFGFLYIWFAVRFTLPAALKIQWIGLKGIFGIEYLSFRRMLNIIVERAHKLVSIKFAKN